MIHAVTDKKNKQFYTHLSDVFRDMGNTQSAYNWLVISHTCYPRTPEFEELFSRDYVFLSGHELTDIVEKEDFQWVWAVFCLFEKDVPLSKILEHPTPCDDYWPDTSGSPAMLHPLSVAELCACDSCCTILLSRKKSWQTLSAKAYKNETPYSPLTSPSRGNILYLCSNQSINIIYQGDINGK